MPKIFNTSWLAVILATLAFYIVGFIWYGFIFSEAWLSAAGMTAAESEAMASAQGPIMFVWGLLVTLGQAIGVLMVLHLAGVKRLPACLKTVFWLVVTIAAPLLAYASLYQGYPLNGYLIDVAHILVGYLVMAAIYAAFRGKDKVTLGES